MLWGCPRRQSSATVIYAKVNNPDQINTHSNLWDRHVLIRAIALCELEKRRLVTSRFSWRCC